MIFGSHGSPPDPLELILCLDPGVVLDGRAMFEGGGLDMNLSPPDDVRGLIRSRVSLTEMGRNWQSEAMRAEL